MTKWLRRGIALLLVLVLVVALAAWWAMRASLATLDGQIPLPGLASPASVQRDALGTVTIDAGDEIDAMRALGYVHAQERYFEMDLLRRTAAGELAELFGPIAVDTDKRHRVHRLRARVSATLDTIAGAQRPLLQAYVDGVNAGLRDLKARPWPYLLLRQQPQAWRIEDTPLVGYAMYFDLQGGDNADEYARWTIKPHLPAALYALLTHPGSSWDAPLFGNARGDARLPTADQLDLRKLPAPPATKPGGMASGGDIGSNNFAVAGTLTVDGRAIVADDMHLGLRAPNIWFRARLRYPDAKAAGGKVDAGGFSLPGLPGIVVGSGGHVAWAFTNSYGDYQDWQLQAPCTGEAQAADCTPLRTHRERIAVAGADAVDFDVEETAWGPVLHRLPDGHALALRWAAHLPGSLNLGLVDLPKAGDIAQALAIADRVGMPTQNLLLADRDGRIAWRLLGPIATREGACSTTHLVEAAEAGATEARCEPWRIATDRSPRLAAPASGRLWTANARTLDGEALQAVGDGGLAMGARARQIRDALFSRAKFAERDLLEIQLDDRALFLQRWHALLRERAAWAKAPALSALSDAAKTWEGHATPQSVSYRIVRAWRLAVHARMLDGLTAPAQVALGKDYIAPSPSQFEGVAWPLAAQRPPHLLSRRYQDWDALFEDAAIEVRDELAKQGPLAQRRWGERNTAAICHPLARAVPLAKPLLCMPADELAGDTAMPRVAGPGFGASERMVVSPGHEADGIIHMPGGQSGHPLSPFWGAGHDDWVHGRPTPFLPGAAIHTLRLQPTAR
ncbi:MAG: penicillin acylase family protein [Lysobacteraceae bacterium]|nr:MAG: penicillin acylase family protein [Xanthomonadaceae bacterium]